MKLTFKDAIGRMPQYLYDSLLEQYDRNIVDQIIRGYMESKTTTLRVNTLKTTVDKVCEDLTKNNIEFEKVSWSENIGNGETIPSSILAGKYMQYRLNLFAQSGCGTPRVSSVEIHFE